MKGTIHFTSAFFANPCGVVRGILHTAMICIICTVAMMSQASDTVTLRSSTEPFRGEIIDYTGETVRIQNASGHERVLPASEVLRIDTKYCPEHTQGDLLYSAGKHREAIEYYLAALEGAKETREWVRRQILARITWCHRAIGDWEQAAKSFFLLLESDPMTTDFDAIPLAWQENPPTVALQQKSLSWLAQSQQPAAILIGASHLLMTQNRAQAITHLRQLLNNADPRIAWLAYAQLWRAGNSNATAEQRSGFARRISTSDPTLCAGAYFVLGQAYSVADPEAAALAMMRIPVLYPQEEQLAATALLWTAGHLERQQRPHQAMRLYREICQR